ncbi:MAG: hypothetical protein V3S46_09135 [Nitrospinota bacterium]
MNINLLILISAVILLAACMAAAYFNRKKKLQKELDDITNSDTQGLKDHIND